MGGAGAATAKREFIGLALGEDDDSLPVREAGDVSNLVLRAEICERLIDRDVAEARTELNGLKAMINASLQETRRLISRNRRATRR